MNRNKIIKTRIVYIKNFPIKTDKLTDLTINEQSEIENLVNKGQWCGAMFGFWWIVTLEGRITNNLK